MIEEIIKLLTAQLDGFRRKIELNPKDAKLQAQYWELIAQHEEIISKARGEVLSQQYNNPKKNGGRTRTEKSIQIENSIYNTIESNGGTASHRDIAKSLQIPNHSLYHYLSILTDNRRIVRIGKGTYAINSRNGLTDEKY